MNKRNQVGNTATANVGVRVPARRLPVLARRRTRQPQHTPGSNSTSHCRHTRVASQNLYRTARSQSCVRHHSSSSHGSQSPSAGPSNKREFVHAQSADVAATVVAHMLQSSLLTNAATTCSTTHTSRSWHMPQLGAAVNIWKLATASATTCATHTLNDSHTPLSSKSASSATWPTT
jgi:hypothetical protein